MKNKTIKKAFKDSLPVLAGYLVLGIGFGVLLQSKGYSVLWAVLMSITIFSGSMQYVAVYLLSDGVTLFTAALMTVMINARYFFYGITMLDKYRNVKWKPYLIFALTDETFALVCSNVDADSGIDQEKYYLYVSIFDHCYWITGSVLGALMGTFLSFNSKGIDFAMTSLFVVIFIEQWTGTRQHTPAIFGVVITLICLLLFGAESFVIPAMLAISGALLLYRGKLEVKA